MTNAILYRMPSGIPGDISRQQSATVETGIGNASLPFPGFGLPGKIASGKFVPIALSDVATDVYGFLVRPYPTTGANASDPLGTAVPSTTLLINNIMRRGYMTVTNNAGTPALKGQVYTRVSNPAGAKVIGGVEATFETALTGAAAGGNTGNGTIGTLSADATAPAGVTVATMLTATTFRVVKPDGTRLKDGATGSAYTAGGMTFTITVGGTPMVAGDSFNITNTPGTVAIPNCTFAGPADASGNVEIEYNI